MSKLLIASFVRDVLHAPGHFNRNTHWIRDWVGYRDGLGAVTVPAVS
jgi:hypothetical protein